MTQPKLEPHTLAFAIREAFESLGAAQQAPSILRWVNEHYPGGGWKDRSVGTHLRGCSVNQPRAIRDHPKFPRFLFNSAPGEFELYDSAKHGFFDDRGFIQSGEADLSNPTDVTTPVRPALKVYSASSSDEFVEITQEFEGRAQFAYEAHLRDYLARNLSLLEPGLRLWSGNLPGSVEYPIDGGRVDILARDSVQTPVVIELKLSRGHDRTIGQALRYRAALKESLGVSRIRIILVAASITKELKKACLEVSDVASYEFSLAMSLRRVSGKEE